ncbi:MAG: diphthamide biosynthesis enzyme Dph2 [Nanoarchaeota archaeon]|nr:diphthamide biosynthesis enzyme Dph2 [Nanoarchaeota archaeon]
MAFDFEKDFLVEKLKEIKPKKVLVQLPEGIKQNAFDLKKTFEDLGIEAIFSGESCWGGCAIAVTEAKDIGADLIVHFGHAKFIDSDFPILYIEVKDILNLEPILKKSLEKLKDYKIIGFSYSIQHRHDLDKIVKFYEDNGKTIILSEKLGNVAYEGHIVGCQYRGLKAIEDKVDAFVIMGNNFHSMGAVLSVNKPVILIDVYNDDVRKMEDERDKILKQRAISIQKFKDARKIGILTEIKPGQKFGAPKTLIEKFEKAGKEVVLITISEITPEKLMNFYSVDAFVELACPRIAIDDFAEYDRPIITFKEARVALGEMTWDELLERGIV